MSLSYRSCLEGLYLSALRMPPLMAEINESRRRIVQTVVWFTSSLIISVYVKDIQYAIALIGGLAALFIFFYPGKKNIKTMRNTVEYRILRPPNTTLKETLNLKFIPLREKASFSVFVSYLSPLAYKSHSLYSLEWNMKL